MRFFKALPVTLTPEALMSAATFSPALGLRAVRTTFAPAAARARTVSAPIPEFPPAACHRTSVS